MLSDKHYGYGLLSLRLLPQESRSPSSRTSVVPIIYLSLTPTKQVARFRPSSKEEGVYYRSISPCACGIISLGKVLHTQGFRRFQGLGPARSSKWSQLDRIRWRVYFIVLCCPIRRMGKIAWCTVLLRWVHVQQSSYNDNGRIESFIPVMKHYQSEFK